MNYIDELNNYLMERDKENFLKRYIELIKEFSSIGNEHIELRLLKNTYDFLFVGDFEKLYIEIEKLELEISEIATDEQMVK